MLVGDEAPEVRLLWLQGQRALRPPPPPTPTPRQGPGQHHWAPPSLSLNSPGQHPSHTVQGWQGCAAAGGVGRGDSLPRGLPFDSSTVPQMHSSPRPHPDPQRPLPLLHARLRVGTEEPGSGPGSFWVTLSESLRISEPWISGRVNTRPQPAEGLWSPQALHGPSNEGQATPGRGLIPPRWSPPARHPGV